MQGRNRDADVENGWVDTGEGEGGRETQEGGDMGIYVYVELIHFVI